MIRRTTPIVLALALAVAGCGGGGGSGPGTAAESASSTAIRAARLAPNQSVQGGLSESSPRLVSVDPGTTDESHFQAYQITLANPGRLTVKMQSSTLDSYLQLFEESFLADPTDDSAFIAESDDVGTTLDAMISEELPAGTYVVLASSAFDNAPDTGSFQLTTTVTP